jgi:hypothetical protein
VQSNVFSEFLSKKENTASTLVSLCCVSLSGVTVPTSDLNQWRQNSAIALGEVWRIDAEESVDW